MKQIGFVVPDLEAALESWMAQGIGPWFRRASPAPQQIRYRGELSMVEASIVLANAGDVQGELIHQDNDAPSVWREFVERGMTGFHHWSLWPSDYDNCMKRVRARGFAVVQENVSEGSPAAYVQN